MTQLEWKLKPVKVKGQAYPDDGTLEVDPTMRDPQDMPPSPQTEGMAYYSRAIYAGLPGSGSEYKSFYFRDYVARRSQLECLHDLMQDIYDRPAIPKTNRLGVVGITWKMLDRWMGVLLREGLIEDTVRNVSYRSNKLKPDYRGKNTKVVKTHSVTESGLLWMKMFRQIATPFYMPIKKRD